MTLVHLLVSLLEWQNPMRDSVSVLVASETFRLA